MATKYLSSGNPNPLTHTLQQLIGHKQLTLNHNSPPLVLQYEDTATWSDEDQGMQRKSLQGTKVVQQIQLEKYINAAQQIQWQHEDHTFAQKMLLCR